MKRSEMQSGEPSGCLAVGPFVQREGFVVDANGSRVVVCSLEYPDLCDRLYAEDAVDAGAWFICPKCGRLGQRMEEAPPERCGLKADNVRPDAPGERGLTCSKNG